MTDRAQPLHVQHLDVTAMKQGFINTRQYHVIYIMTAHIVLK